MLNHDPRIEILSPAIVRVTTPLATQLHGVIFESVLEDADHLQVRWTQANMEALAVVGFDPPSPFRRLYCWTADPRAHQIRTVEFMSVHKRCGVWNEQGTGKTLCGLALVDYLHQRKRISRALVLCPVSVMRPAWVANAGEFTPHLRVRVAHGNQKSRIDALRDQQANIVVMNYEVLEKHENDVKAGGFDLIICDEANYVKNARAGRTKALFRITNNDHVRLVLMTGTPASQSPEEAYGLGRLLRSPVVPRTMTAWRDMVMVQYSRFVWRPKSDSPQLVAKALSPSIRFSKEDCLDLPERVFVNHAVEMSAEQTHVYAELKREAALTVNGATLTASNAAIMLSKLLQAAAGAVLDIEGRPIALDFSPRMQAALDIIQEAKGKVIIFVNYTAPLNAVLSALLAAKIPTEKIEGSVPEHARTASIERFQVGPPEVLKVLVIQPAAAAHGITLTAADTVIWWGPPMSVELYKQANDRAHRIGQKRKVTVFQFAGSLVERKYWKRLQDNVDIHHAAVDLFGDVVYGAE